MRNVTTSIWILFCACLVVFTPSCSFIRRVTAPPGQEHKVIDETAKQAQAKIAAGEYKKALELYANAYDKYHYSGMRSSYARTTEQIRNAADAAYQKKDFAEAGSIYNTLFESGITTRDFARSLSFDDDYLSGQINLCSKGLLENGLRKYREEKLDDAIAIWKTALVFDPEDTGVKNAIDTATLQLQKLKSMK